MLFQHVLGMEQAELVLHLFQSHWMGVASVLSGHLDRRLTRPKTSRNVRRARRARPPAPSLGQKVITMDPSLDRRRNHICIQL